NIVGKFWNELIMKPIYIFAPHWMGEFNTTRVGMMHHTWKLLFPEVLEGTPMERMGTLCQALADEVAAIRANGNFPVVIAGDCTFSIGTLAGLQREISDAMLIWYDAHGDFNTHETTPSGFVGGMPLAMLAGHGDQTIMTGANAKTHPEEKIILTDARDLDPEEGVAVSNAALKHLPQVSDLMTCDIPEGPLYIHFDSDVLSTTDLPAVNYPAEGGPTIADIDASLTRLAQTGRVAALSVTMWDPALDDAERSNEGTLMGVVHRFVEQLL
ncbi:MAG: arginase family protein, partial [Chloroflexota bacterium]